MDQDLKSLLTAPERNPGVPLDLDRVLDVRVNQSAVDRRAATLLRFLISVLCFYFVSSLASAQSSGKNFDAFEGALRTIQPGASTKKARHLIGAPDRVIHQSFASGRVHGQIWDYGERGPEYPPTFGRLYFANDRLVGKWPGLGLRSIDYPPARQVMTADQLKSALNKLDLGSSTSPRTMDLLWQIRASNALITLGTDKALVVLRAAAREHDQDERLLWLTRIVFTVPKQIGYFPLPWIGAINPIPPNDLRTWPLFPVVMIDDIPLNVFEGARLYGYPEPADMYLDRLIPLGLHVRSQVLRPPDNPFEALDHALAVKDPRTVVLRQAVLDGRIDSELLSLVAPIHGSTPGPRPANQNHSFREADLEWDSKTQFYVVGKPRPPR